MQALVPERMISPLIALVGRPNVGKSTLFNRLVGRRQALMHDQPGVTRDRIFGKIGMDDVVPPHSPIFGGLRLVDTGGLVDPDGDPLFAAMMLQTRAALADADVVVLVVDGQAGIVPYDKEIAREIRRLGKPVIVAVNKIDIQAHAPQAAEFYALGGDALIAVSAEHNRQVTDLREAMVDALIACGALMDVPEPAPLDPYADLREAAQAEQIAKARALAAESDTDSDSDSDLDDGPVDADGLPLGWQDRIAQMADDEAEDGSDDAEASATLAPPAPVAAERPKRSYVRRLAGGDMSLPALTHEGVGPQGVHPNAAPADLAKPSQVEWTGGPIRVAVVGRPNVGKSSLINAILGQSRLVASHLPGTTRDAVDTAYSRDGQEYVLIDTAGIRRQRAIGDRLEALTVNMAFDSMDRADVVVLVLDGVLRPTDQDAKIAAMADSKGVGIVVVASKWDLTENPEWKEKFVAAIHHDLPFIDYAPVIKTSSVTGRGMPQLFAEIQRVQEERHRRVSTGELNRFFKEVVQTHPPPAKGGKRPHLFFVSQPLVRPPTFVFASRGADALNRSYHRYLMNALRRRYGFNGTPLWLKFRESHRRDTASKKPTGH